MLVVSTTSTDQMDALGSSKLCISWLATELKLALLAVVGAFGTGGRSLMTTISTDA